MSAWSVDDHRGEVMVRLTGVSRGRSTGGGLDTYAPGGVRAGQAERHAERMNVVAGDGRGDRSQPAQAGHLQEETVKPSVPVGGRSGRPASPESSSQPQCRADGL